MANDDTKGLIIEKVTKRFNRHYNSDLSKAHTNHLIDRFYKEVKDLLEGEEPDQIRIICLGRIVKMPDKLNAIKAIFSARSLFDGTSPFEKRT